MFSLRNEWCVGVEVEQSYRRTLQPVQQYPNLSLIPNPANMRGACRLPYSQYPPPPQPESLIPIPTVNMMCTGSDVSHHIIDAERGRVPRRKRAGIKSRLGVAPFSFSRVFFRSMSPSVRAIRATSSSLASNMYLLHRWTAVRPTIACSYVRDFAVCSRIFVLLCLKFFAAVVI